MRKTPGRYSRRRIWRTGCGTKVGACARRNHLIDRRKFHLLFSHCLQWLPLTVAGEISAPNPRFSLSPSETTSVLLGHAGSIRRQSALFCGTAHIRYDSLIVAPERQTSYSVQRLMAVAPSLKSVEEATRSAHDFVRIRRADPRAPARERAGACLRSSLCEPGATVP